ncbi:metalloregulator ArsR/SmtB family transcription factor [Candidatus Woesebacteria bacterium]|nr:metalloregulator ArsR/SmtB family transcription factor [Candidatus Woesebacteria bacterium]
MYTQIFELQADLLQSLAHPRRLEIIQLLRDQELPVSDIHTMLDLPQANISQHLMILRDAQVVKTRRDGKQVYYSLNNEKILQANDLLREVLIDQYKGTEVADDLTLKMKDLVPVVHDPVCQMRVSPKTASFTYSHQGEDYFFCASGCLKTFKTNPEKYTNH